ncbi:hypothetical protein GGS23DRAFT_286402 [Durotheca rogersii]|uniref:uncharacterized protein n=1 Tax=Durotheca rogersii TaxID=419775 RepID=UPI00222005BE|nr:uncharacterized protein GGS23DRAFT_286402 [Durotheca rogersii]KAI5866753.1 hypothetical protein GGS23DRAFT_286402 [Durotheca rogersii]
MYIRRLRLLLAGLVLKTPTLWQGLAWTGVSVKDTGDGRASCIHTYSLCLSASQLLTEELRMRKYPFSRANVWFLTNPPQKPGGVDRAFASMSVVFSTCRTVSSSAPLRSMSQAGDLMVTFPW